MLTIALDCVEALSVIGKEPETRSSTMDKPAELEFVEDM